MINDLKVIQIPQDKTEYIVKGYVVINPKTYKLKDKINYLIFNDYVLHGVNDNVCPENHVMMSSFI